MGYTEVVAGYNTNTSNIGTLASYTFGWSTTLRIVFDGKLKEERLPIEFMKLKDKIFDV